MDNPITKNETTKQVTWARVLIPLCMCIRLFESYKRICTESKMIFFQLRVGIDALTLENKSTRSHVRSLTLHPGA